MFFLYIKNGHKASHFFYLTALFCHFCGFCQEKREGIIIETKKIKSATTILSNSESIIRTFV